MTSEKKDDYNLKTDETLEKYGTSEKGLASEDVNERREKYGPNEITKGKKAPVWGIFIAQFNDFLIIILIIAAMVSYSIGFVPGQEPHVVDAVLILVILLANGIFGFIQDYKAERSIEALKEMTTPSCTVLRDGEKKDINSKALVPGDILFLEQGCAVPADARILEEFNLEADESALTGESLTISKEAESITGRVSLAERTNMVYKGTNVTRGRGQALVVGTGMDTQVGKIATAIQRVEKKATPFQKEINQMGKKIGIGVLGICAFVAIVQLLAGGALVTTLLVAISLAVAAVPEGLPAIVTLALALGSKKMVDKNTLVRRLSVVESLGSVDIVCTDKTGTLTEDQMKVKYVYFDGHTYGVTKEGLDGKDLEPILKCGVLCNNSEQREGKYKGDPTEIALLVSGKEAGLVKEKLESENPRTKEISFTSKRKRMTTVHEDGSMYMKGAPEVVLDKCNRVWKNGGIKKLTKKNREKIKQKNRTLASNALRVLGFACKKLEKGGKNENLEEDLIFLGLQGMLDPPRKGVKEAIQDCKSAGIKVIMITGDNASTAQAIGKEIGIRADRILEGQDIEDMDNKELQRHLQYVEIFARVSPSHKVKILKALQKQGWIVAMTGDGVNDAPALKNADVGVSMGIRGTDVAKQASDMVLLDDNFNTIRDAISEGRGIFDNIRKFVNYLLSANAAEVMVVFLASVLGPLIFAGNNFLVLTAVMLLWINLLTDGLPALALGVDPKAKGIMKRGPRPQKEGVINKRMVYSIVSMGGLMSVIILGLFGYYLPDLKTARTVAFTSLVIFELVRIQAVRSRYQIPLFSNKWLWAAVGGSIILQLIVLYTPLNVFFKVAPLGLNAWYTILGGVIGFGVLTWLLVKIGDWIFDASN